MIETPLENIIFLHPQIQGIDLLWDRFYASSNKTEGKFFIYKRDDRIKLYGLLWSDDSVERKSISGDWYDFDMRKIDYVEIPQWIFRVKKQEKWNKRLTFEELFAIKDELVGGGYLTFNPWDLLWTTMQDRDFQRAPVDVIKKCLEIESRVMKVEVVDEINKRVFRYENPWH